jgi:hypothetical protein
MGTVEPGPAQQSGQTPDKEVKINHFIVYGSGYTESNLNGMLSPNNCQLCGPTKQVCFSPDRQSSQTHAAVTV